MKIELKWSHKVFDLRMKELFLSVTGTATSEAVNASHYVYINLQVIKFIAAICALSNTLAFRHSVS